MLATARIAIVVMHEGRYHHRLLNISGGIDNLGDEMKFQAVKAIDTIHREASEKV